VGSSGRTILSLNAIRGRQELAPGTGKTSSPGRGPQLAPGTSELLRSAIEGPRAQVSFSCRTPLRTRTGDKERAMLSTGVRLTPHTASSAAYGAIISSGAVLLSPTRIKPAWVIAAAAVLGLVIR